MFNKFNKKCFIPVCLIVLTLLLGVSFSSADEPLSPVSLSVDTVSANGILTNDFEIKHSGTGTFHVNLFFALYDGNNNLLAVRRREYSMNGGDSVNDTLIFNVAVGTYYQKAMLWDDEMVPFAYSVDSVTDVEGGGFAYVMMINDDLSLKILDGSGEIMTLATEAQISIDNVQRPAGDLLANNFINTSVRGNLIKYKMNTDGKITEILTKNNAEQDAVNGIKFTAIPYSVRCDRNVPSFILIDHSMDSIMLDSSTIVFNVPRNPETTEDRRFSVGGYQLLRHGVSYSREELEVFNVDKINRAKIVVLRYGAVTNDVYYEYLYPRNMQYQPYMVNDVSEKQDENGVMSQYIAFVGGSKFKFSNNTLADYEKGNYPYLLPSNVKRGDIVIIQLDDDEEIYNMACVRNLEQITNQPQWINGMGDWAGSATYTTGRIQAIIGNVILLKTAQTDVTGDTVYMQDLLLHFNTRGLPIQIFDTKLARNPIYIGDMQDLAIGDVVMLRTTDGWMQDIFAYKSI